MTFISLPAVDVAGGQAVRLQARSASRQATVTRRRRRWLGRRPGPNGSTWSISTPRSVAGRTRRRWPRGGPLDIAVELSGGIRDDAAAAALATGCARVNVGTAALERPEWVRDIIAEHGERVAVGLDVRGNTLAARGWTRDGGDLDEALARLDRDGCRRFVVTDVTKDGTLAGPSLDLLRRVCARTGRPVIASGGVSSLDDLRALATLAPLGVEGAIVGKALYAGAFTLEQALEAVKS
jgi:phosphoribosylanthranilate isomerase